MSPTPTQTWLDFCAKIVTVAGWKLKYENLETISAATSKL